MKNTYIFNRLIGLFLIVAGLSACYDDLGNYDYSDLNDIEVTGIDEEYVVEQFKEFIITPTIKQKLSDNSEQLEYLWHMYPDGRMDYSDTLSYDKDLNVTVFSVPGDYKAVLRITDLETGIFTKYLFKVKVVNAFSNGLIILSNINDQANVALWNSAGNVYADVYQKVNVHVAGKHAVAIGHINNRYEEGVLIMCKDDMGGVVVEPNTFEKYQTYKNLFWLGDEASNPDCYFEFHQGASSDFIIEDGNLHSRNFMYLPPNKYGAPETKNCDLYPALFKEGFMNLYVYDNNNKQFLARGWSGTGVVMNMPEGLFNPADMNMTMICGGNGFKEDGFGLFSDDDNETIYSLQFAFGYNSVMPLKKVEITSAPELKRANSMVVSSLSAQYFYAVDNKLYCLDALNDINNLVYTFDSGVTIDHIELNKAADDQEMFLGTTSAVGATEKPGSVHVLDVEMNGTVTLRESKENIAGKVVDFLYK